MTGPAAASATRRRRGAFAATSFGSGPSPTRASALSESKDSRAANHSWLAHLPTWALLHRRATLEATKKGGVRCQPHN